jgi:glycosyltransferase involved in cell wall biosynthesis
MRIAIIAAGAGDMYCGSCLRDHALARALLELGEEVTIVPTYTPMRLDGEPAGEQHVYFGGVEVFLAEKFSPARKGRGWLGRLASSQRLLRWLGRRSLSTHPSKLGGLTCSVLRGEEGHQARLLEELVEMLKDHVRPDLVHLTNSLYVGFARRLKQVLGVPVTCGLTGEDLFLANLSEPHRSQALGLLAERSADVDGFISSSHHAAQHMATWGGIDPAKTSVVHPGIRCDEFLALDADRPRGRPFTLGYFSRIAPEKGLHYLVGAFRKLAKDGRFPDLKLKIAGYLGTSQNQYAAQCRRVLAACGLRDRVELLGTVDRAQKVSFFESIDLLAVPTDYPEPKGMFVLESLAAGVPVVLPSHGAFPELVEATGGGVLHAPRDVDDLAAQIEHLLEDEAQRTELGRLGRKAIQDDFGTERMALDTRTIFRSLTGD